MFATYLGNHDARYGIRSQSWSPDQGRKATARPKHLSGAAGRSGLGFVRPNREPLHAPPWPSMADTLLGARSRALARPERAVDGGGD